MTERAGSVGKWTVWPFPHIFPLFSYPESSQYLGNKYGISLQINEVAPELMTQILMRSGWVHTYKDLFVLDIGAGQNDFSVQLRSLGAVAYAVDPEYSDLAVMDQKYTVDMNMIIPPNLINLRRLLGETRDGFKRDVRGNSQYYKGASSTDLPFEDNTFDLEFSHNCVSTAVNDSDMLIRSFEEIIRTLKPGGKAKIFPYDNVVELQREDYEKASTHDACLKEGLKYLNKGTSVRADIHKLADRHQLLIITK